MRARRPKSRGPEIVISLAALGLLTLAGMCVYIRGCGNGNMTPVLAAQVQGYWQQQPWNLYSSPLVIAQSTTLKVVAVTADGAMSPIVTGTYTINPPNGPQSPGFVYPLISRNATFLPGAQYAKVSAMPSFAFQADLANGAYAHHDRVVLPNPARTPGVVGLTTKEQICFKDVPPRVIQPVSEQMKFQVCADYMIDRARCIGLQPDGSGYKIDHLIPIGLGGTDDEENLWPQPYNPRPAVPEKIAIGDWLHSQVCSDQMNLTVAQRAISGDWFQAFQTAIAGEKQWPQNAFIEKTGIRPVAASGKVSGGLGRSGN